MHGLFDTAFLVVLTILIVLYAAALHLLRSGLRNLAADQRQDSRSTSDLPAVSIVVAARNEAINLPRLLPCLLAQDYPHEKLEAIIVDDRSDDSTWSTLEVATKSHPVVKALRVTDTVPGFAPKKRALDLAIRTAKGEIILLTDADCTPAPTWTRSMIGYYSGDVVGVVGYSPYRFDEPGNGLIDGMLALDYVSIFAVAAASAGLGQTLTGSGTNLSYRKQTFIDVGGFESIKRLISGDDDLFIREVVRKKIGRFTFALDPAAFVPTAAPTSLKQFWNQRIRYASKGLRYGATMTLGLLAIYLLNLLLVVGIFRAAFGSGFLLPIIAIWLVKAAFEMMLLSDAMSHFREKQLMKYFLPTALLHPLYISLFGFLGLIVGFEWKSKTVQTP